MRFLLVEDDVALATSLARTILDGHSIGDHLRNNIPFALGVNQDGVRYGALTCPPLPRAETTGR